MDATPPSISRHSRQNRGFHLPRRTDRDRDVENQDSNLGNHAAFGRPLARNQSDAPASPELISSLITSLSVISPPAIDQLEPPLDLDSPPASPRSPDDPRGPRRLGSFGVDYGAFSKPSSSIDLRDQNSDLDELAAAPPVVKTAKPPSGYSSLTAPKSPTSGGGLRSFLSGRNASRPSSRGSSASKDADVHSLGNISIERGLTPGSSPVEVRKQRSVDSWGKKTGQAHNRLKYMTSKERLSAEERRRASAGDSSNGLSGSAMGRTVGNRSDSFLGETPITEEPPLFDETLASRPSATDGSMSPHSIPQRDSSLRKTSTTRRSSARMSRSSRRNSSNGAIPEEGFDFGIPNPAQNGRSSMKRQPSTREGESSRADRDSRTERSGDGLLNPSWATTSKANHYIDHYVTDTEVDMEDGAPAPSIAQGKRRDREVSRDRNSRRFSGHATPELRIKRSSSKMKRRSGAVSPREDRSKEESGLYERPPSADSIDDSIAAYMRSPRLSQKIKHPQTGRIISFSEVGDAEGSAVFCCVGMGLTRYITAFYDELALTLKLRLITPDRPGVGDSEPYTDGTATPLSWPDDVYAICQALKITKFSILAHSAGAIYALATALRMPQHIRGRIHLLAPWIPPSQMSVFGASAQAPLPPTNAIPTSQKLLRALPTPFLKAANSSFMSATSSSITSSLPKQKKTKRKPSGKDPKNGDRPNLDKENYNAAAKGTSDMPSFARGMDPTEEMDQIRPECASPTGALSPFASEASGGFGRIGDRSSTTSVSKEDAIIAAAESALADKQRQETYDTRLTHTIWEVATTGANPAVDLLVCLERRHTIGFRYVDITRPVVIHHGSRDNRVPVENVKWLGKTMRRCEVRVLEGEGHGLMASAAVMGTVLMEISKEWEDWNKATGQTSRKEGKRANAR
ncbi:hypothetical protein N0V93_007631 [Gnomoniopsis smithogilvyi]|uniref:AB hydrolase-1 domain-containing protein n=1 Tax=Gnomoniopsis smithogilvyi TaxID=1191159 RepID=A0A9W9CWV1_9PEZI|nr:hypothetical protein N0V93_007631 [Gnomoniopsis smithogilvyi]